MKGNRILMSKSSENPISGVSRIRAHQELDAQLIEALLVELVIGILAGQDVPRLEPALVVLGTGVVAQKVVTADEPVVVDVEDVEESVDIVTHVMQRLRPGRVPDKIAA